MSFRPSIAVGPPPSLTRAFMGLVLSMAACAPPGAEDAPPGTLDALFVERGSFVLEEQPGDSIAEPGAFVESATGDLHLADALLPRIRTYRSDGSWVAATGRFGDGPFEFRRVRGLWEEEPGRLWVVGSGAGRIRVFHGLLQPVEERSIALAPSGVVGGRGGPFILGISADAQNPATRGVEASPMVHSLSAAGELTASFWTPPERGAFIAGAGAPAAQEWVQAATVMSALVAVGEERLVVVHARLDGGSGMALAHRDYALDVWDLPNRRKIGEDLPLPEGTQVLGGGRFLYLVEDGPPWTVHRLEIRE